MWQPIRCRRAALAWDAMNEDARPLVDPLAPWPTLAERDASKQPDPELHEDIPPHLDPHMRSWVASVLRDEDALAKQVLQRLRVSWTLQSPRNGKPYRAPVTVVLNNLAAGELDGITPLRAVDRLTVINAIVGLQARMGRGNRTLDRT